MSTLTLKELIEKATESGHLNAIARPLGFVGEPTLSEMIAAGNIHARCSPATMAKVVRNLENAESDLWKRYGEDSPLARSIREALNLLDGKPTQ